MHERFLYRLSISPYRRRLILKGGMLLAALDSRRPTADIDLLARGVPNDRERVAGVVAEILAVVTEDGVAFDGRRMTARVIRDQELYAGVRLSIPTRVDRAEAVLRIDVNVGDPVTPGPVEIIYPALLEAPIHLLGYPLATILAEKVVTMIDRGGATTRERDFADVLLLSRRHPMHATELLPALEATAEHRQSTLRPLAGLLNGLGPGRQRFWSAYLERSGLAGELPHSYSEGIGEVMRFADPLLNGEVVHSIWDPIARTWRRRTR
ncbi:MAG TPA: nucleotidyl transferase AbiEii/AbiGii toxin family protein [Candidatus Dormibacteraeota bacterium]|nr:nucleotidyl transferase AbiEii/AbiGii toxin family protein [Candidatus Dormibacteraeota bacterium]